MSGLDQKQAPDALEQDNTTQSFSSSTIASGIISRSAIQKTLLLNPALKAVRAVLGRPTSDSGPELQNEHKSDQSQVPAKHSKTEIHENQTSPDEVIKSVKRSLKEKFFHIVKAVGDEFNELVENPLKYAKKIVESAIEASLDFGRRFINTVRAIPSMFLFAIELIQQISQPSAKESVRKEQKTESGLLSKLLVLFIEPKREKSRSPEVILKKAFTDGFSDQSKNKGPLTVLFEGIKKIAEALTEKKKQDEIDEAKAEQEARRKKIEEQAKKVVAEARQLRPELADEIEISESDMILGSAFNELPNVDALIEQAEQKKAAKARPLYT